MCDGAARVGRVVLASCDAFDNFPPGLTGKTLVPTGRLSPTMFGLFMQQMRIRAVRRLPIACGWLTMRGDAATARWMKPVLSQPEIRRDAVRVLRAIAAKPRLMLDAAERLPGFNRPALVVWASGDRVMPPEHGRRLADWMLPVMFAQQPLEVALRLMDDAEQAQFYERAAAVGEEPQTEYGFVGRDLDIQAIEHHLLADPASNVLLVRGMAGAGKFTLLHHLAWWWQRTGLIDRVFRFSYEDRAWTAGQIIRDIRSHLLSPAEHARADSMSEAAQAEQVAGLLRASRHLLILDNTESITAAPAAIPHALSHYEQQKLKSLVGRLRDGKTLVLLGSREAETWLGAGGTGIETYLLPGLDAQAASVLVERILRRYGATANLADPSERKALDELVTVLGGYPLPLTVVLPVLASAQPWVVLAELQAGGEAADPAGLIRQAVEYSHGKLDPALQASLQLLAPFTAVIPTGEILKSYQDLLLQDDAGSGRHGGPGRLSP